MMTKRNTFSKVKKVQPSIIDELVNSRHYDPEHRLLLAVLISGIRECDVEYLKSETFVYHCDLLDICDETIFYMMVPICKEQGIKLCRT